MSSLGSAGDSSRECILHNESGRILAPSLKYCASYISHTLCLKARRQFLEEFLEVCHMEIAAWNYTTVGTFPLAEFVISMRMAREWSVLLRGADNKIR